MKSKGAEVRGAQDPWHEESFLFLRLAGSGEALALRQADP